MPADLEIKTKKLANDIMRDAYNNGYFDVAKLSDTKLTLAKKRKFAENAIFACMTSEAWRQEFAKWTLLKPLEAAKLMVALMDKKITIDGDLRVQHAIVVPATATPEQWNKTHEARKMLQDGDWGTDLEDTPFKIAKTIPGEVVK